MRFHDEACGLLIGGLSLFSLLSLLSWGHSVSRWGGAVPTANWGGELGHWLASALVLSLGGGAFLVVGLLGQAAYLLSTHAVRLQRLRLGLGGLLLVAGAAPLLHVSLGRSLASMGDAGGLVGWCLGEYLLSYCNVGGTLLLSAMAAILGGRLVIRAWLPGGHGRAAPF